MSETETQMSPCTEFPIQRFEDVADLAVAVRDSGEQVSLDPDYVESFLRKVDTDMDRLRETALVQYGVGNLAEGLTKDGMDRVLQRMDTRYGCRIARLISRRRDNPASLSDLDPKARGSLLRLLVGYTIYKSAQARGLHGL